MAVTSPRRETTDRDDVVGEDDTAPAPSLRLPKGRRRPWLIAVGITLVATCGVAGAGLVASAGDRVEVLAVAREVAYGQALSAKDLTTARVSAGPAVETVPAAKLDQVVGQIADSTLTPGELLTPAEVTEERIPETGRTLVPIALKPSQLPAQGLRPGDEVQVVSTPGEGGEPPKKLPQSIDAEVVRVGEPNVDGLRVVDVEAPSTDGPTLASRVATGRIAIVVDAPGGR